MRPTKTKPHRYMSIDATYMAMLVSGVTIDGTTRHTFSEVTLSDCIYNELKYLKVNT